MSLLGTNFDDIDEGHLRALIEAAVPESVVLDYKQDTYARGDDGRREFLKDVSAFANSSGGHLIIGIKELNGGAGQLCAIDKVAEEIARLENTARDGLQPRIAIRMKPVELSGGGAVILIYVPRSWNVPHRVSAQNSNRFYLRNSNGVHEASLDELRRLFLGGAEIEESARAFRASRVSLLAANEGPMETASDGRLILHVVPLQTMSNPNQIGIDDLYKLTQHFWPIGRVDGMTPRVNMDGLLNYRGGPICHGFTQIFRSGVVEATRSSILREHDGVKIVPAGIVESIIPNIESYLDGLKELNVPAPLAVMVTLQGVAGARLATPRAVYDLDEVPPFRHSDILLPDVVVTDYGDQLSLHRAIRPIFDTLWNSAGYFKSSSFNDEGMWVPDR